MEKLKIKNFAGIEFLEFEFNSINILIGPQGAGKSVSVKLLYFFKNLLSESVTSITSGEGKRDFDKKQKESFIKFFPKESWPKGDFIIEYTIDSITLTVSSAGNSLSLEYSESLKKILEKSRRIYKEEERKTNQEDPKFNRFSFRNKLREKITSCLTSEFGEDIANTQLFIPAGRSFFANLQKSIFSFLSDNRSLDPFLIEFGSFYENFKGIYSRADEDKKDTEFDKIIAEILNSKYHREKEKDFLLHSDGRKVNLLNASSGQQESLPLLIILKTLNHIRFTHKGATIYIEEPEAHLYPNAQKGIVQLLARTFNNENTRFQIIVTTHSPYILSSFNNLIEGGKVSIESPIKSSEVNKIIPPEEQILPDLLCAYALNKGKKMSLIDDESGLISQTMLDDVSNEITREFSELLNIEFN